MSKLRITPEALEELSTKFATTPSKTDYDFKMNFIPMEVKKVDQSELNKTNFTADISSMVEFSKNSITIESVEVTLQWISK